MARYIDAERLSREVVSSWDKDKHVTLEASRVHRQEHHHLISIIEKQPTADVVPKSEVEKIFAEIETCMEAFEDDDDGYLLKKCEFEFFMREIKKEYTEEKE